MKRIIFSVLVVLALMTVSPAQKTYDLTGLVVVKPATVAQGQPVDIELYVVNNGEKEVTIREVELYWGTSDHTLWTELLSSYRLTIAGGEMQHLTLYEQTPSCAGTWNIQARFCFTGGGKRDLLTLPATFTVTQ